MFALLKGGRIARGDNGVDGGANKPRVDEGQEKAGDAHEDGHRDEGFVGECIAEEAAEMALAEEVVPAIVVNNWARFWDR